MSAGEYPFKWIDVPDEELKDAIPNASGGYISSVPGNVWMPKGSCDHVQKIYNMQVRKDDIWLVTYPKCGTTWTQELLWQIINNVDKEGTRRPLFARSPYLEAEVIISDENKRKLLGLETEERKESENYMALEFAEKAPSPRILKTHLPVSMLPPDIFAKGGKVVYVCRNPLDACVSYYHHTLLFFQGHEVSLDTFEKMFMEGRLDYGDYWYHLKDAFKYKDEPNFKLVWYEDMKKDLIAIIRDMSKFLGYHLTELKILTLDDHLYIGNQRQHGSESMSNGDQSMKRFYQKFFRKGQVGDWKNHFDEEKRKKWKSWIEQNLEGTDLKMTFE